MPSKGAIDEALERMAHRFGKGPKWIAREVVEWERCSLLMECEDDQLERAVSAFVAGKESYHLDGFLAKLGKKRQSRPAGDGCLICTSGMIELAVWYGDEVSATNPMLTCIRCKCNKGRSGSETIHAMRYADPGITEVYSAVELVNGRPERRFLNREETGEAQRTRIRIAGMVLPGSVAAMDEAIAGLSGGAKPVHKYTPPVRNPTVAAAMEQLRRLNQ